MRGRIVSGAMGLGCAGLTVLMLVTPASGERSGAGRIPAEDVAAACEEASMSTPPSDSGDVKLTADVPDGATVSPGDDVLLKLTWDPKEWSGPQLDRALACVRVKGGLDPDLSAGEEPTENDGIFEYRLHVPDNIREDCDICVQAFLAGEGAGGGQQQVRSDRQCFMSGPPAPDGPPTPPVTEPVRQRPAPTPAPTPAPEPVLPPEVRGITATAPEANPAPARIPDVVPAPPVKAAPAELPRTGTDGTRPFSTGGGLALALGGLAVIGGAGRRSRRNTDD